MARHTRETLAAVIDSLPLGYAERESHQLGQEFTYGELTVEGLVAIMQDADAQRNAASRGPVRCFLDLGSGTGKAVLAAATLFPSLEHAIGVELSKPRHRIAADGCEALTSRLADDGLLERAIFIHGDARHAIAPIAAADVIWVSNTCFPESLNAELGAAIDGFAHQGALVYSTRDLGFQRRLEDHVSIVSCEVTWADKHHAAAFEVKGHPVALSLLGGGGIVGTPAEQAFARWAVPMQAAGHPPMQKEGISWCVRRHELHAALAHALLPTVSALLLVEDLYMEEGALLEICEEALTNSGCAGNSDISSSAGAFSDTITAEGLAFEAFEEVCNQYLETIHGTWTWRLGQFLNCAFCSRTNPVNTFQI